MKKIVIVLNNMEVGGVQKSLYNLLWEIHRRYDVTLFLFQARGAYLKPLPPGVKLLVCKGPFRYLGKSQREWSGIHRLVRGALALTARTFGRRVAMKMMLPWEKKLPERYDCAIAFLQNGNIRNFYGGVQEFVLHQVKADKKIAFLHCDYGKCGSNHPVNNKLLDKFDRIALCSDGCRQVLEEILPELAPRCVTVRNCHRLEEIRNLATENSVCYDTAYYNIVMVSRLSHEKGIERALEAVSACIVSGIPIRLHIVGDGSMRSKLEAKAEKLGIDQFVHFYGEQKNPYRYMKCADLFLMTSYHEAAPMVLDEARSLCLPVLTVETTSSHEMVTENNSGWVCDNSQEALTESLKEILSNENQLCEIRNSLRKSSMDNAKAIKQFIEMIEAHV